MCLPAAYETVHTWIQGFGLQPMPDEDLDAACKDLRLLIFPGTQVLQKQLLPALPAKQGPLMTPPWAEESAAPVAGEGQDAAHLTASIAIEAGTTMDASAVDQYASAELKGSEDALPAMVESAATRLEAGTVERPVAGQDTAAELQGPGASAAVLPTMSPDTGMKPAEQAGEVLVPDMPLDEGPVLYGPDATEDLLPQSAYGLSPVEALLSMDGLPGAVDHQAMLDDSDVDITSMSPVRVRQDPQVHFALLVVSCT